MRAALLRVVAATITIISLSAPMRAEYTQSRITTPPTSPPPRDVPAGSYVCATISASFHGGNPTGATIGTLRVMSAGIYTGLTTSGAGPKGRFDYDPSSGRIRWEGGSLKGFSGRLVDSRFDVDSRGVPYFALVHRARDGGKLLDVLCRRESDRRN
jgi:hypothetical protein